MGDFHAHFCHRGARGRDLGLDRGLRRARLPVEAGEERRGRDACRVLDIVDRAKGAQADPPARIRASGSAKVVPETGWEHRSSGRAHSVG